jgi:hypothetical protein
MADNCTILCYTQQCCSGATAEGVFSRQNASLRYQAFATSYDKYVRTLGKAIAIVWKHGS